MIYLFKKLFIIICCSVALALSVYLLYFSRAESVFKSKPYEIIIDAGHGLPDGGAVASDGTIESDINLEIVSKLVNHMSMAGFKCTLTRNSRDSIYSSGETIHAKKVSDIKERIKIADANKDSLFISVHMNTFTTPDVYGTQVFYKSHSELSKDLASELQRVINLKFQPDNEKVCKPIPSNVYLFNNIENDCILIECGFLTNNEDLKKLKNSEFQTELTKSITEVLTYKLIGSD